MVEERVQKAAKILHLEPLLERKPKALSGGQRQRVAIGRSIVREPKVFLFDEPLSNLDAELRVRMRLEIAKLHNDLGATMVYVTHDQVEAMTLADKIVVLRDGRVEQAGAPMHLYNDPDNIFVGGFIGSPKMNFLNAEVLDQNNGLATVKLHDYFSSNGNAALQTTIEVVESLGGTSFGYADAQSESPLTMGLDEQQLAEARGEFIARFDAARAFLFDKQSTLRIR